MNSSYAFGLLEAYLIRVICPRDVRIWSLGRQCLPEGAIASAGPSTSLPILVFVVVFAAFCVLAILLDRLVPARPKPARSDVEPLEQPVKVKKTA